MKALELAPNLRYPDLFVVRRARKDHRCRTMMKGGEEVRGWDGGRLPHDHTPVIRRGDPYVEYMGESAAYESGSRYCSGCSRAAGLAREVA
jgi:hypothetical protein